MSPGSAEPALSRNGDHRNGNAAPAPSSPGEPRLAVTRDEAAALLSMSRDSLERYVLPEIRTIRVGRMILVPRRELERWVERSAARWL